MDALEHEDLLIKLRAKLNEAKIKLWEPPYLSSTEEITQSFQDLVSKLASELSTDSDVVRQGLLELQQHSLERSKANEEFKETGCATLRVKAAGRPDKGVFKVMKKLSVMGLELIETVAEILAVDQTRLKLIFNGKVIKPTPSLEEQGVKNGIQLMALIMADNVEEIKKEDDMFLQMKSILDDVTLILESNDDSLEGAYMNLEDQTGNTIELPEAEKRALFVGLALHESGRACIKRQEYSLALYVLLEADRQLSDCRAQILNSVDNYGVLQLDIAWCYLCLRSLQAAGDAAARLAKAEEAFDRSYGVDRQRLIALKGTDVNERVLLMRLHLLQGIVAYHQNRRARAAQLLDTAERELNSLRVERSSVQTLMELGWSEGQACAALREQPDVTRAHHLLHERAAQRARAREQHDRDRARRALGVCADGRAVSRVLLDRLRALGAPRAAARRALRAADNDLQRAIDILRHDAMEDSDVSEEESETTEPNSEHLAQLISMGFEEEAARAALLVSDNDLQHALDVLDGWHHCKLLYEACASSQEPSTSTEATPTRKRQKKEEKRRRREAREQALRRLRARTRLEADDYLASTLADEEHFLAQYKSLL